MGKGKRKERESISEPRRGFPDAFDDGSSSDSGPSTGASTSRDKGKRRAVVEVQDEDEDLKINTMWQSEDGRKQWLARLDSDTTLHQATKKALRHLRLTLVEDELPRIVHVRQEGKEIPIEDDFDFEALKNRALASQDRLYPVIIRIYTSEGMPLRRQSTGGPSLSISPAKLKAPLSSLKRSTSKLGLAGSKQSLPTPDVEPAKKRKNRDRKRKKRQSLAKEEPADVESHMEVDGPAVGQLDATPQASTSKRPRPSSPTSTPSSVRRKKLRRNRASITPSKVEKPPPSSPDSNIHPALRATIDEIPGKGLHRYRPAKPSPLVGAAPRDPLSVAPSSGDNGKMKIEENEALVERADPVEEDHRPEGENGEEEIRDESREREAESERQDEQKSQSSVNTTAVSSVQSPAPDTSPQASSSVSTVEDEGPAASDNEVTPAEEQTPSSAAESSTSADPRSPIMDDMADSRALEPAVEHDHSPDHSTSETPSSRHSEQPSDPPTSATSRRSLSPQLDISAKEAPTEHSEHILSPRQPPPPQTTKTTPPPPSQSPESEPPAVEPIPVPSLSVTRSGIAPQASPSTSISSLPKPTKPIELTKPAWNLFRKPASPVFTSAYSSSSIDTPPEGSAQYRKRTRKKGSSKTTESTSAEPAASMGPSTSAASASSPRKQAADVQEEPDVAPVSRPVVLARDHPSADPNSEAPAPEAKGLVEVETSQPSTKKRPPSLSAQIMAKHRAKLGGNKPNGAVATVVEAMPEGTLDAATTLSKPSSPRKNKRAPLVEAARSAALRSQSVVGLDVMDQDLTDVHPSLLMPEIEAPNVELPPMVQSSPTSRDADSVEDVVGEKTPITAQSPTFEDYPAESSTFPTTSTHLTPDLAHAKETRRAHRKGRRLEGIDLDIEDKEMDGLSAAAQRAKLAGRGICLVCGASPIHLQKDCPKVKGGVETLQILLLQRQAEAESEQARKPESKESKNGIKGQVSEETRASIEAIESWIRRLTTVRNRVIGLEVNVESKSPAKELTMAEELDLLSGRSVNTAAKSIDRPISDKSARATGSRPPAQSATTSTSQSQPSHLPPLLQKALAKPRKAGSTSGVSASDALIETGDSGSDSDSEASDHAPSEGDSTSERSDDSEEGSEDSGSDNVSSSDASMEEGSTSGPRSPSSDDDLTSFMKRPPTKDQLRRVRLSAASMQPVEQPSVALVAESVDDDSSEDVDERLQQNDWGSSIGDFEGVESHKAESDGSRSVIDTHTPPPVGPASDEDIPADDGATAIAVTGADQSTRSSRSLMPLLDRGSSSPVVDTVAGAQALREAIEEERTPMTTAIGLPPPPALATDLPATQLAKDVTSNSQTRRPTKQPSSSLAPAAEISPGKVAVRHPKSSSVQPLRQRSTSRSSAIIQAHRNSLPKGRSRLSTSSSPETRLRQFPNVDSSPETAPRKRSTSREVVVELPSKTKTTRMSLAPVSEQEDTDVVLDGTARATESPRMATRSAPHESDAKVNGSKDRMITPERSVAPSSSSSSIGVQFDFYGGMAVKTPVQPSPKRSMKTRSSQVDELEASQPIIASSSTVKREAISQRNNLERRAQPNGTSQASVTSSRGKSSLVNGVSDSFPDPVGTRLRSSSSHRTPTRSSPVLEGSQEGSKADSDEDQSDGSVTGESDDDNTTIPSRQPTRHPVALHRRAESQQIINPIPSLSQLPTEMLRNGSMRSHLRSSAASQPTPASKRFDASSGSESDGESEGSSSEEDNVPPEKRGRMANGRKPKQKKSGAPVGGW